MNSKSSKSSYFCHYAKKQIFKGHFFNNCFPTFGSSYYQDKDSNTMYALKTARDVVWQRTQLDQILQTRRVLNNNFLTRPKFLDFLNFFKTFSNCLLKIIMETQKFQQLFGTIEAKVILVLSLIIFSWVAKHKNIEIFFWIFNCALFLLKLSQFEKVFNFQADKFVETKGFVKLKACLQHQLNFINYDLEDKKCQKLSNFSMNCF